MKTALIVFVRHPVLGKVKTRLASTLGEKAALIIYQKLLSHTLVLATSSPADKFIFYADELVEHDMWSREGFSKQRQANGDLGYRMLQAFETVFAKGYDSVMIIGSDCHELTAAIVQQAFWLLQEGDVVIGPARDGGYYLLGMKKIHPKLFIDKAWSTSTVFSDTQNTISELGLTCRELPLLNDVDEEKDVPLAWLNGV